MHRTETNKLHRISRSPGFLMILTDHAEKRMVERDVARFEVERLLKAGLVIEVERDHDGTERRRVAGRDADGKRIAAVVEPLPPIQAVVVTVIRVD